MGRHRRSAAGPVAADHADVPAGRHQHGARRRKKRATPVRTGLLGVSAAVALGAVAVTSGLVPGADNYSLSGGGPSDRVRAEGPADLETQGGSGQEPTDQPSAPASQDASPQGTPSKSASPKPKTSEPSKAEASRTSEPSKSAKPSTKPSTIPSQREKAAEKPAEPRRKSTQPDRTPAAPAPKTPDTGGTGNTQGTDAEAAAEAAVLSLVNQERSKAGCSPVRADNDLAALAGNFSEDMAARDFFDHTDPDGAAPWDRAERAGITGLAAENIARGQSDAQSVMDSWMNSEGHRANILNCEYKTLGVGVHMASGGPWWTQNFGF
ncbi:CAP domain-containing protein [Streptomyces hypolithicus]